MTYVAIINASYVNVLRIWNEAKGRHLNPQNLPDDLLHLPFLLHQPDKNPENFCFIASGSEKLLHKFLKDTAAHRADLTYVTYQHDREILQDIHETYERQGYITRNDSCHHDLCVSVIQEALAQGWNLQSQLDVITA